jgi:hypothetical protein
MLVVRRAKPQHTDQGSPRIGRENPWQKVVIVANYKGEVLPTVPREMQKVTHQRRINHFLLIDSVPSAAKGVE